MKHVKQCQSKGNDTICIDVMVDLSRLIRQRFMIDEVERRTSRALQREQAINFSNSDLASHCSEKQIMTWYATRKVYFLHFWLIQMDSDVFRFSAAISIPVDVTPGGAKHPIAQQLEEKLQKTICYLYEKICLYIFCRFFLIVWSKKSSDMRSFSFLPLWPSVVVLGARKKL